MISQHVIQQSNNSGNLIKSHIMSFNRHINWTETRLSLQWKCVRVCSSSRRMAA